MNLEQEERRGEEAKYLLLNPLLVEAFATIESRIVDQLSQADTGAERRARLNDLLIANRKVRQYLEQVVATGTMAAMERESIASRVARKFRAA